MLGPRPAWGPQSRPSCARSAPPSPRSLLSVPPTTNRLRPTASDLGRRKQTERGRFLALCRRAGFARLVLCRPRPAIPPLTSLGSMIRPVSVFPFSFLLLFFLSFFPSFAFAANDCPTRSRAPEFDGPLSAPRTTPNQAGLLIPLLGPSWTTALCGDGPLTGAPFPRLCLPRARQWTAPRARRPGILQRPLWGKDVWRSGTTLSGEAWELFNSFVTRGLGERWNGESLSYTGTGDVGRTDDGLGWGTKRGTR